MDNILIDEDYYYKLLHKENTLSKIELNLKCAIYSIDRKIEEDKIFKYNINGTEIICRNKFQQIRLKGIRSKCKELLKIIEKEVDE